MNFFSSEVPRVLVLTGLHKSEERNHKSETMSTQRSTSFSWSSAAVVMSFVRHARRNVVEAPPPPPPANFVYGKSCNFSMLLFTY